MTLRHKFGALALVYVAALAINVVLCAWCIIAFYNALLGGFAPWAGFENLAGELTPTEPTAVLQPNVDEQAMIRILLFNVLAGIALAMVGMRLVHRWVSRPVAELREAAAQIGAGNLQYRLPVRSADELGTLAGEVNDMAATVLRMRADLVARERQAVAAQTLRCVIHNIRSPLTGIRWLAEAITMRRDVDPAIADQQTRIMGLVDKALQWLQGFRHTMTQGALKLEPTPLAQLLREVAAHGTEPANAVIASEAGNAELMLDHAQMRDALGALAGWLRRSDASGRVPNLILSASRGERAEWCIRLTCRPVSEMQFGDSAAAASCEPAAAVLPAAVTTARRVIEAHGGRLEHRATDDGGCEFILHLPRTNGNARHMVQ